MTPLRQKMTDELVRRNHSEGTANAHLRRVESFANYFNRPPDQPGPEQIREYVAHPCPAPFLKVGILPLEPAAAGPCHALNLHPGFCAACGVAYLDLQTSRLDSLKESTLWVIESHYRRVLSGRGRTPPRCCPEPGIAGFHAVRRAASAGR